jgi:hypothetical protein
MSEQMKTLFHCTSAENAASIRRNGFRCGTSGLAGGGIYLAETEEDAKRKAHQHGVVIKCEVDLGKVHKVGFDGDESLCLSRLKAKGCNSVSIARKGTEYCVYEPQRVAVVEVRDAEWLKRQQQQRKEAEAKAKKKLAWHNAYFCAWCAHGDAAACPLRPGPK